MLAIKNEHLNAAKEILKGVAKKNQITSLQKLAAEQWDQVVTLLSANIINSSSAEVKSELAKITEAPIEDIAKLLKNACFILSTPKISTASQIEDDQKAAICDVAQAILTSEHENKGKKASSTTPLPEASSENRQFSLFTAAAEGEAKAKLTPIQEAFQNKDKKLFDSLLISEKRFPHYQHWDKHFSSSMLEGNIVKALEYLPKSLSDNYLKLIFDLGYSINYADVDGQTLLMKATELGHKALFLKLLLLEADIHTASQDGRTALQYIPDMPEDTHRTIIDLLFAYMSKKQGLSFYPALSEKNKQRIVKCLIEQQWDKVTFWANPQTEELITLLNACGLNNDSHEVQTIRSMSSQLKPILQQHMELYDINKDRNPGLRAVMHKIFEDQTLKRSTTRKITVRNKHYYAQIKLGEIAYLLESKSRLGGGSYGTVHKVINCMSGQQIFWALKVSHPERSSSLRNEQELLQALNPEGTLPGVQKPPIFSAEAVSSTGPSEHIMAMPLYNHGNLRKFLHSNPDALDIRQRLKACFTLLEGMTEMHKKGIVHGDVKAYNIFVQAQAQADEKSATEYAIDIADFGGSGKISSLKDTRSYPHSISTQLDERFYEFVSALTRFMELSQKAFDVPFKPFKAVKENMDRQLMSQQERITTLQVLKDFSKIDMKELDELYQTIIKKMDVHLHIANPEDAVKVARFLREQQDLFCIANVQFELLSGSSAFRDLERLGLSITWNSGINNSKEILLRKHPQATQQINDYFGAIFKNNPAERPTAKTAAALWEALSKAIQDAT